MWLTLFFAVKIVNADLYHECGKLFNPHNYLAHMPYINNVPIKPTPIVTTKVFNVVTKYVFKNPVCVKISGKKSMCKPLTNKNNEHLVTKEYFVKDGKSDDLGMYIQGSEEPRPFGKQAKTPELSPEDIKDMLIEDRLDQLETILPYYTRRRTYETSTITVTKVKSNNRAMATLLVKNCVPQGYDLCPPKAKARHSKVARLTNRTTEAHFFG